MTDKWIGHRIVLSNKDGLYHDDGTKYLDLLSLEEDLVVDENTHPILASRFDSGALTYNEVGTLVASDAEDSDNYGISCAVYGDRLIVGAYYEDTVAADAGKIYVYDWNETTSMYDEVTTLTASDAASSDYYGVSCAVYGDRLIVGAYYEGTAADIAGKVYVYDWNETTSTYDEVTTLTASDATSTDRFGTSCAVYGNRLIIGAYAEDTAANNAGKIYVYDWNETTSTYDEVTTLTASDAENYDFYGTSCAVYGNRLIVGAYFEDTAASNAGKVYVYDWNETTSTYDEVTTLTASDAESEDYYGMSCAIYGDRLIVGAYGEDTAAGNSGKIYVYGWNETTSTYDEVTTLTASDAESSDDYSRSCAVYGDRLIVGASREDTAGYRAGKIYTYTSSSVVTISAVTSPITYMPWKIVADLYPPAVSGGSGGAGSSSGDTANSGYTGSSPIYLFTYSGGNIVVDFTLTESDGILLLELTDSDQYILNEYTDAGVLVETKLSISRAADVGYIHSVAVGPDGSYYVLSGIETYGGITIERYGIDGLLIETHTVVYDDFWEDYGSGWDVATHITVTDSNDLCLADSWGAYIVIDKDSYELLYLGTLSGSYGDRTYNSDGTVWESAYRGLYVTKYYEADPGAEVSRSVDLPIGSLNELVDIPTDESTEYSDEDPFAFNPSFLIETGVTDSLYLMAVKEDGYDMYIYPSPILTDTSNEPNYTTAVASFTVDPEERIYGMILNQAGNVVLLARSTTDSTIQNNRLLEYSVEGEFIQEILNFSGTFEYNSTTYYTTVMGMVQISTGGYVVLLSNGGVYGEYVVNIDDINQTESYVDLNVSMIQSNRTKAIAYYGDGNIIALGDSGDREWFDEVTFANVGYISSTYGTYFAATGLNTNVNGDLWSEYGGTLYRYQTTANLDPEFYTFTGGATHADAISSDPEGIIYVYDDGVLYTVSNLTVSGYYSDIAAAY